MQIPYEVSARRDTGLYNAKLGIWLFLASEVMLFGGLFSAYIFQRLGAEPGYWPHGLLNVPVGMGNTIILIASSVTVVLAWASLKMRRWNAYWWYMLITILCGITFLTVKLAYEWPQKFVHFGVFVKKASAEKYEPYLGNKFLEEKGLEPRYEISGHIAELEIDRGGKAETIKAEDEEGIRPWEAQHILEEPNTKLVSYTLKLDEVNAEPTSAENERPHFIPRPVTEKEATIKAEDIEKAGGNGGGLWASAFLPRHSTYFGTYFLITGLHGLHVLAGVIVFIYMWLFGKQLYLRNPEHMANRVEVAGLFWHFVDLVWIFVFPIFYLL
jgi:cytochrome c oxidase subunit 3